MERFYTDSYLTILARAKEAEKVSDWKEAAKLWRQIGNKEDADACELLHKSIERGDAYRAHIMHRCGPEPEVYGDKQDSIKWMNWFKNLEVAAKEFDSFYKNGLTSQYQINQTYEPDNA